MKATSIFTKIFVCAGLMFSVCLAPAMAAEADVALEPQEAAPIIAFDATKFEFDVALDSDLVTHTYTFKNIGTADLEIKQVKTG